MTALKNKVRPRHRRVSIDKAKIGPRMVELFFCCGTVTRRKKANVGSFCIQWGVRGIGFGGVTVARSKDGKLYLDTEHMGREFCAKVFHALGRKIIGPQAATDGTDSVSEVRLGTISGTVEEKMDERRFWYDGEGSFVVMWTETFATGAKERACTVSWKNGKVTADCKEPILPFVLQQLALSSETVPDVGQ